MQDGWEELKYRIGPRTSAPQGSLRPGVSPRSTIRMPVPEELAPDRRPQMQEPGFSDIDRGAGLLPILAANRSNRPAEPAVDADVVFANFLEPAPAAPNSLL